MKKVLSLLLVLAMVAGTLTLASCDETEMFLPVGSDEFSDTIGTLTAPFTSESTISDSSKTFPFDEHAEGAEAVAQMVGNSVNLMPDYFDELLAQYTIAGGLVWDPDEYESNSEWVDSLLDGNPETKWCRPKSEVELASSVVWSMAEPVTVTHYSFTTANNSEIFVNRNPVAWRLYGSNQMNESMMMDEDFLGVVDDDMIPIGWELIDQVWDSDLPDANYTECGFSVDKPASYQYYMLLIDRCDTGDSVFQLAELTLYGHAGDVLPPDTEVPFTTPINGFEEGAAAIEQMVGDSINLMTDYLVGYLEDYSVKIGYIWPIEGAEDVEGQACILDGDPTTKWCAGDDDVASCTSVVWSMSEPVTVTHYSLTTANDNASYPGRNPVAWRLYGTNQEIDESMKMNDDFFASGEVPDGWELIDLIWATDLPDVNFTECGFTVGYPAPYQYYMLLIDGCDSGSPSFQISEFTLYGRAE